MMFFPKVPRTFSYFGKKSANNTYYSLLLMRFLFNYIWKVYQKQEKQENQEKQAPLPKNKRNLRINF
jgi:hypothetical protein